MKRIAILLILLSACAPERIKINSNLPHEPTEIEILKTQVDALLGTQQSIDALISSEFSTCDGSGATSDALIAKICNISKAATEESKAELKGQLVSYSQVLSGQITSLNDDIASTNTSISSIQASITAINGTIATLQSDMTTLQSAVTALQAATASINGVLNTNLVSYDVGIENIAAGPAYETILKRVDSTRFNGYVQALSASVVVSNAGLSVTNASPTVTVTTAVVHGLVVGNKFRLSGAVSGRGLTTLDVTGDFIVVTVPSTTTLTYTALHSATSSGSLGGNSASLAKFSGEGLGTLWVSSQVSDVAVRQTNLGSKVYNFIIRRKADITKGELCYSKTDNAALFATINAAPENGNAAIKCL